MKARIPMHREFVVDMSKEEDEARRDECWQRLNGIMDDYKKEGKSIYTETFIEDNEEKVKALQGEFTFSYVIEEKK